MSTVIGAGGQMFNGTAVATGSSFNTSGLKPNRTFHLTVTGTGAVSATANVQVSNDDTNWMTVGTLTASGTTAASDGLVIEACWLNMRIDLTAISGTSARAIVTVGG